MSVGRYSQRIVLNETTTLRILGKNSALDSNNSGIKGIGSLNTPYICHLYLRTTKHEAHFKISGYSHKQNCRI